jgi:conjugal transfer pilus assembly protein TraE
VLEVLAEQVREIQRERVSMRFTVRELLYDPASDTVFVTGIQTTTGPGGKPVARPRTYEVVVGFQNYRPVIRHLDVYPEEPRVGDKAKTPNIP